MSHDLDKFYISLVENIISKIDLETEEKYEYIDSKTLNELCANGLQNLIQLIADKNVCIVETLTDKIRWEQILKIQKETIRNPPMLAESIQYEGRLRISKEIEQIFSACQTSKLIVIPFSIWNYTLIDQSKKYIRDIEIGEDISGIPASQLKLLGHQVLVIINMELKSVEFYDSNGSEAHRILYGDHDYNQFKKFLILNSDIFKDFNFLNYQDTCPEFSFQSFNVSEENEFGMLGYCKFWSIFNAHLRIIYPNIHPIKLQEAVITYFKLQGPNYFDRFIQTYIIYLKNLSNK